jgi:DnaJ-class molecular chaperone
MITREQWLTDRIRQDQRYQTYEPEECEWIICPKCNGSGGKLEHAITPKTISPPDHLDCMTCDGKGKVFAVDPY